MFRSLLAVALFASSAAAQVAGYAGSVAGGGVSFRPYVNTSTYSGSYLPAQSQYLNSNATSGLTAAGAARFSTFPASASKASAAVYGFHPNYPGRLSTGTRCPVDFRPAPQLIQKPFYSFVRVPEPDVLKRAACDPYEDEYGCLGEDPYPY